MALIILIAITIGVTLAYKRFSDNWRKDNPGQAVFRWKTLEEIAKQPSIGAGEPDRGGDYIDTIHGGVDPTGNGGRAGDFNS